MSECNCHTHRSIIAIAPGLIMLSLMAAGCIPLPSATPGAATLPVTPISSGGSTPTQASPVRGPGSFDLADPASGLAGLKSYSQSLKITFDGQQAGKASQYTTLYTREVVQQPPAWMTAIDITNQGTAGHYLAANLGEEKAIQAGANQPCQVSWGSPSALSLKPFELASFLPPLAGAEAAGDETVGGIDASAYKFDQRALGHGGSAQATGEVWIANQGGWVVKFSLALKGDADVFGQGSTGEEDWNYSVSSVNSLDSIQLPAGCPEVLSDIPTLADANAIVRQPGYMKYLTTSSITDASGFYLDRLKTAGWTNTANIKPGAKDATGQLVFTRTGRGSLIISLKPGSGALVVTVQEAK